MTDELKALLKGSIGIDIEAEFKYVPVAFRHPDIPQRFRAIFTMTGKDGLEIAAIEDSIGVMEVDESTGTHKMHISSGKQRIKTLEAGIVAVENYPLADGSILSFDKAGKRLTVGDKKLTYSISNLLRHIPASLQVELANAINEQKFLTQEELTGLGF